MKPHWGEHSVLFFMGSVFLLPLLYIIVSSLIGSSVKELTLGQKLAVNIIGACLLTATVGIATQAFLSEEVVQAIMQHTQIASSGSVSLSVSEGGIGDTIQTVVVFLAISGVTTLIGNKISRRKMRSVQPVA